MAVNEIVDKLNQLIAEDNAFSHEKDVVYFMVQLRKLMERDNVLDNHKSVKFYCDWVVHPKKSRNHDDIYDVYSSIYDECVNFCNQIYIEGSDAVMRLMQFDSLRRDIEPILQNYGIDIQLTNGLWVTFTRKLLCVLKDQPLEASGSGIREINISEADGSTFILKITFESAILDSRGYSHADYTYGLEYISRTKKREEVSAA